ncbi:MAG: glycosyltransferase family 4 protein [Vicinamibacterales bacterium]
MASDLRLTVVNAAFDPAAPGPEALLDRYATLTGWCDAMTEAGASVRVVQRYSRDRQVQRGRVEYVFVADGRPAVLPARTGSSPVAEAVALSRPHLLHVNGLGFPALLPSLRRAARDAVLVVQDHAGARPPEGALVGAWRRLVWRRGLGVADAVSFTADAQARPWQEAGILRRQHILGLLESSTAVRPAPRIEARRRTGLRGDPLVLSVGRLVPGKEPLAVLAAFERLAAVRPAARLAFVYQGGSLEPVLRAALAAAPAVADHVTLVGGVPHAAIGDYYGAADLFVSGSRAEGSGYALIEAMACGLAPVVTDIPPFRAIAGPCGRYWRPGDVDEAAAALVEMASLDLAAERTRVRAQFEQELSWAAIASRTMGVYRELLATTRVRDR